MNQPTLFPLWSQEHENRNLAEKADQWIKDNPDGYLMFTRRALALAEKGKRIGMKALAEFVRAECLMGSGEEFKLNNSYVAYIGRRLAREHPHLANFIETRTAKFSGANDDGNDGRRNDDGRR